MHNAQSRAPGPAWLAWAVSCAIAVGGAACRGKGGGGAGAGDTSADGGTATAAADAGAVVAARCRADGAPIALPEASWGAFPVFGDAVEGPAGYVVAVTRDVAGKRTAGVATVDRDGRAIDFVPLGAALPDDPPPRVARAGDVMVAAFVDRGAAAPPSRAVPSLAVAAIDAGKARVLFRAPQPDNPELAFDVAASGARIAVAWLEETPAASRVAAAIVDLGAAGPVQIARDHVRSIVLQGAADAGTASAISAGADVDAPRLTPRPGGFWAAWLATSPEPGPEAGVEGAAEARSWGWVEAAALDANGKRIGDVRRLTPARGHVATFDVAPSGAAGLAVVARDALEAREGEGSKLLRAGMVDETTVAPTSVVTGRVGRGVPDLVPDGAGPWVAYADVADRAVWTPLAPGGASSGEPELEDGRVLGAGDRDGRKRLLVARKRADAPGELRLVSCNR